VRGWIGSSVLDSEKAAAGPLKDYGFEKSTTGFTPASGGATVEKAQRITAELAQSRSSSEKRSGWLVGISL